MTPKRRKSRRRRRANQYRPPKRLVPFFPLCEHGHPFNGIQCAGCNPKQGEE